MTERIAVTFTGLVDQMDAGKGSKILRFSSYTACSLCIFCNTSDEKLTDVQFISKVSLKLVFICYFRKLQSNLFKGCNLLLLLNN